MFFFALCIVFFSVQKGFEEKEMCGKFYAQSAGRVIFSDLISFPRRKILRKLSVVSSFICKTRLWWMKCIGFVTRCSFCVLWNCPDKVRGSLWNFWHPPSQGKSRDLFFKLWFNYFKIFTVGLSPSLDPLNQDRKRGRNSTFERNLNVALPPW